MSKPVIQRPAELLLVGSSSSDPYSTIFIDPRTGVSVWSYKGSELQGASSAVARPLDSSGEYILLSVKDRPLIHCLATHNRDRFHQKAVVSGPVSAFCSTRDGRLLFVAVRNQLLVWLLASGELLSLTDAHYQAISSVQLSEDESIVVTTSNDGSILVYLVSELISAEREHSVAPLRKWKTHSLAVKSLSVSRGIEPRIATCGLDHIAAVHSIALDACILKISADRPLTACVLDPAETRMFVGSDLGNIAQINLYEMANVSEYLVQTADESNEKVPVFNGHSDEISALAVSSDGSLLASGDITGKYCIWGIVSRQCLKVASMRGSVTTLLFTPNFPTLSASEHTASWRPSFDLQRNRQPTNAIALRTKSNILKNTEKWQDLTENLIEQTMFEMRCINASKETEKDGAVDLKKKRKNGPAKNEEPTASNKGDVEKVFEGDAQAEIERLRNEIKKLKRINNELYTFAAKELTKPSRDDDG